MYELSLGDKKHMSLPTAELLLPGEKIYIIDDDPGIRAPLKIFLEEQGLAVVEAGRAEEFLVELEKDDAALVLLDIGLPDIDGKTLLPRIVEGHPDVAVIMLTGVADLKVAIDCIREGAEDYLTKPVKFDEILLVVKKALEKRRLVIDNRKYHEDLEKAHFRINVLHQLSVKMNTAYLSTVEVDEILQAVLVGITADEGLRFNRAFLAMFDDDNQFLLGRMAIGPSGKDDASRIWNELQRKAMTFMDIVHDLRGNFNDRDNKVNQIVQLLKVPVYEHENILIKSARERRTILVSRENGCVPIAIERRSREGLMGERNWPEVVERREEPGSEGLPVPHELIAILQGDEFVVVPLFSPSRSFGVIIADNFVTGQKITGNHLNSLEVFASQASLAIEHSHLYQDQEKKIAELQALTEELEKSKNLLVEAERFSALGQMSAQLVHSIRNPITSIGGMARILTRKSATAEQKKFLEVISKETSRLDKILEDLNNFTEQFKQIKREPINLCDMLRKTLILVQPDLTRQGIGWHVDCQGQERQIIGDRKHLRQMFLHLIKNSIEAMPSGGQLEVLVDRDDEWLRIAIRDTGVGMLEDSLDKVKDPFFTTKTYGTGMGLTMVENVLKTHGGYFEMNKRESGGLEVLVKLPISTLMISG
jgi:signal transduction histidine kinase/FixJ family two-component response regulator